LRNTKKLFLGLFLGLLALTSCSTKSSALAETAININTFDREEYVILGKTRGEAKSVRVWILFIPFGGYSDESLKKMAYNDALNGAFEAQADGILQPRYTYKKRRYPFILFGWTIKKQVCEGRAFRLKTEAEYEKTKDKNADRKKDD
jgi:hypothetical protein